MLHSRIVRVLFYDAARELVDGETSLVVQTLFAAIILYVYRGIEREISFHFNIFFFFFYQSLAALLLDSGERNIVRHFSPFMCLCRRPSNTIPILALLSCFRQQS
uniref:Uncharacterized protein n=1 Tax=Trypanosoma vivax (strain Y486) TaxID=1055687 RepID=G0TXB7_TRYVY|nr:conserved hypothetical protein [Trypanosoma vivax Y486]